MLVLNFKLTFGFKLQYRFLFVPALCLVKIHIYRTVRAGVRIRVLALIRVHVTFMLCLDLYSLRISFKVGVRFLAERKIASDLCSNTDLRSCQIQAPFRLFSVYLVSLLNEKYNSASYVSHYPRNLTNSVIFYSVLECL